MNVANAFKLLFKVGGLSRIAVCLVKHANLPYLCFDGENSLYTVVKVKIDMADFHILQRKLEPQTFKKYVN